MFEFMKEYEIMQSIEHANVVKLFGVVLETSRIMLITELAPLRFALYLLIKVSVLFQRFKMNILGGRSKLKLFNLHDKTN